MRLLAGLITIAALAACGNPTPSQPAAPAIAPAPPPAPPQPYDFKGIKLGISMDEMKGIAFPDPVYSAESTPILKCELSKTPEPRRYGWCIYYQGKNQALLRLGSSEALTDRASFNFVEDPKDEVLRLYEIRLVADYQGPKTLKSEFTDKFGDPVYDDVVENPHLDGSGSSAVTVWRNGVSALRLQAPYVSYNNMAVTFSLDRLMAIVNADYDAAQGSKDRHPL